MIESVVLIWNLVAALTVLAAAQEDPTLPPPPKTPMRVECQPGQLRQGYGTWRESVNPIADALEMAGPGSIIELTDGVYPAFSIGYAKDSPSNANTSGGTRLSPIRVVAIGEARIDPRGGGDTISISQEVRNGFIEFDGITILAGYRAAVMFTKGGVHEGYHFVDCNINGRFNHKRYQGASSKWGVLAYALKDFQFRGEAADAVIRNIKGEHAFYLHNTQGDVLIERVRAFHLGRTFIQVTSRPHEGAVSRGNIVIRDCDVNDVCIAAGDDYKGGSAFTFAGPHRGAIILQRCRLRAGFDPEIRRLTKAGVPYGSGAMVSYATEAGTIENMVLHDNDFRFQEDCGDRALVTLGGVDKLLLAGDNHFEAGAFGVALRFDGDDATWMDNKVLDKRTTLLGRVQVGTRDLTREERARLGLDGSTDE